MSGTRITDQQVRLYMNNRKHHTQEVAAAKAGISERSARRIERDDQLPSQKPGAIGARAPIRSPRSGRAKSCRCCAARRS